MMDLVQYLVMEAIGLVHFLLLPFTAGGILSCVSGSGAGGSSIIAQAHTKLEIDSQHNFNAQNTTSASSGSSSDAGIVRLLLLQTPSQFHFVLICTLFPETIGLNVTIFPCFSLTR